MPVRQAEKSTQITHTLNFLASPGINPVAIAERDGTRGRTLALLLSNPLPLVDSLGVPCLTLTADR